MDLAHDDDPLRGVGQELGGLGSEAVLPVPGVVVLGDDAEVVPGVLALLRHPGQRPRHLLEVCPGGPGQGTCMSSSLTS